MRWKISIEGSDEITRGHRFEFEIEKSLDDLAAGSVQQQPRAGSDIRSRQGLRHGAGQQQDTRCECRDNFFHGN